MKMNKITSHKIGYFMCFVCFLSSNEFCKAQTNNLIVEEQQVYTISPSLYQLDSIIIKKGAVLKVQDNSSKWLIFKAKVIICEGTIEFINFKRGLGTISYKINDDITVEHNYEESLGGYGGNGGPNPYKRGGSGFKPIDHNGGGGGSGAHYSKNTGTNNPGVDATDYRGAPSLASSSYSVGGNGGRQVYGHGGLICLLADKIEFGNASKIFLNGADGVNGSNGKDGICYGGVPYYIAAGGGGGGSSSGNGGVLIVYSKNIVNKPEINLKPGKPGIGGTGGKTSNCSFYGSDGENGDTGQTGEIYWYSNY